MIGGKQRDGHIDHRDRFGDHAGASSEAGEPMAQPTVDPLDRDGLILPNIMPADRQERVVRPVIVGAV